MKPLWLYHLWAECLRRCVGLGCGFSVGTWSLRLSLALPYGLVLKWKVSHLWAWQRRCGNAWKLPAWWGLNQEVLKERGGVEWGCILVVSVPGWKWIQGPVLMSHTLGFWNAAMGSLRNGPSLRRSLTGRAFWWHLGNMVSVMQAEGERKKHCIHLTRF